MTSHSFQGVSHGQNLMIPSVDGHVEATDGNGGTPMVFDCLADALAEGDPDRNISVASSSSSSLGATKAEILEFLTTLPRNLHWDKQQKKAKAAEEEGASSSRELMETLEEGEEESDDESAVEGSKNEEGLKIAWQYRKSVQRTRLGHDKTSPTRSSASDLRHTLSRCNG